MLDIKLFLSFSIELRERVKKSLKNLKNSFIQKSYAENTTAAGIVLAAENAAKKSTSKQATMLSKTKKNLKNSNIYTDFTAT